MPTDDLSNNPITDAFETPEQRAKREQHEQHMKDMLKLLAERIDPLEARAAAVERGEE